MVSFCVYYYCVDIRYHESPDERHILVLLYGLPNIVLTRQSATNHFR